MYVYIYRYYIKKLHYLIYELDEQLTFLSINICSVHLKWRKFHNDVFFNFYIYTRSRIIDIVKKLHKGWIALL